MSLITTASVRLANGLVDSLTDALTQLAVLIWDLGICLGNLVLPRKPAGSLVALGFPGHGGVWPEFIPPKEGDSRSACPALNAMANHGILPRDGKNISFRQMSTTIRKTYNFGGAFCFFVPYYMAGLLGRSYYRDTLNLSDINFHNGIEHDASLTRHDVFHQPDQSKPAPDLINALLASATGPNKQLTAADLSRFSALRRVQAKKDNPQFSLSTFHKIFGSSNASTMLIHLNGDQEALRTWLLEERIPEGWETAQRSRFGLSIAQFNATVLRVELGINEGAVKKDS